MTGGTVDRGIDSLAADALLIGGSMAVNTPAHGKIGELPHPFHGLGGAVAVLAGNSGAHMRAMVEVNEIRQLVDTHPLDGVGDLLWVANHFVPRVQSHGVEQLLQLFGYQELGGVLFFLGDLVFFADGAEGRGYEPVAVHADIGGGDSGMAAFLCAVVTVEAWYLKFAGMQTVGIGDRLRGLVANLVSRQPEPRKPPDQGNAHENNSKDKNDARGGATQDVHQQRISVTFR